MDSTAHEKRNLEVQSMPKPGSDEAIIVRLAAGESAAFDEIFERYHKQIYNFIRKQVSERENIEDLVQEVFLRVFKSSANFDPHKKFSSWVYKIALNEVKRHWKKSAAKQTFSLNTPVGDEGSDSERQDFLEDLRDLPENVFEKENFSGTLKVLINRLPEKQRTVVILKIYHELTFEEIAEICECPLSTVLSRMRYAVNKLRRWLGVEEDEQS
jgi:RNA polymerase sigma-70 factor (ECF subfamily)